MKVAPLGCQISDGPQYRSNTTSTYITPYSCEYGVQSTPQGRCYIIITGAREKNWCHIAAARVTKQGLAAWLHCRVRVAGLSRGISWEAERCGRNWPAAHQAFQSPLATPTVITRRGKMWCRRWHVNRHEQQVVQTHDHLCVASTLPELVKSTLCKIFK